VAYLKKILAERSARPVHEAPFTCKVAGKDDAIQGVLAHARRG